MIEFKIFLMYFYEITLRLVLCYLSIQTITSLISTIHFYIKYRTFGSERIEDFMTSKHTPAFSLLVPAHNEEHHIVKNLMGMLSINYNNLKVIAINDGSTDGTLTQLIEGFELQKLPALMPSKIKTKEIRNYYVSKKHPNLIVIDKEQGGKADALNAGLNITTTPYFISADADTYLDHKAFLQGIYYFLTKPNSVAAGNAVSVLNQNKVENDHLEIRFPKKLFLGIQTLEYMRTFFEYRATGTQATGCLILPGSFAIFDREAIAPLDGYATDSVTEDLDIVARLNKEMLRAKKPYSIDFVPALVAWTIVPETVRSLFNQRERWQRGTFQTLWRQKDMLFNPFYGRVGLLAMPYLLLETATILLHVACYSLIPLLAIFGILNWMIAFLFLSISVSLCVLRCSLTNLAEQLTFKRYIRFTDVLMILFSALLETFGFHQTVLAARIKSFWGALKSDQTWRHDVSKIS